MARHGRITERQALEQVTRHFATTLTEMRDTPALAVGQIWCANTSQAKWTASEFATRLADGPDPGTSAQDGKITALERVVKPWLGPPNGPYRPSTDSIPKDITTQIDGFFATRTGASLLLVGHEPALGWILDGRTKGPLPPPLDSAELACLVRPTGSTGKWRLWWVLTPSPADVSQLRDKVGSKMTSVALLAGFALAVAVDTLIRTDTFGQDTPGAVLTGVAAGLFSLAAILLVGALVAYDQLMMPPRFWSFHRPKTGGLRWPHHHATDPLRSKTVWRPPSSAAWVLYLESIRIWRSFVHSALALLALGVGCLAAGVAWPFEWWDAASAGAIAVVGGVVVAVALHRPVIGVSD